MNNYNQLKEVLNDIFELNKADLDFGIYRIMNQKRKQVNEFIEKQLPEDIKKALSETQSSDKTEIENELKTIKKNLDDAGIVAEDSPKYKILKERLVGLENSDVLEQEVFSHLANFFKRYYKDGDFISMRRYKKDVYAIPYEGEEVKLHWANHDQYYIKSSENFKNYTFKTSDGKTVSFQLKEVSTEQNNNKTQGDAERRFAIYKEEPVEETETGLTINFIYEPFTKATKQESLLAEALELLTEKVPSTYTSVFALSPTEKNSKRTLLEKHLNDYVSKNSFDYFIHKDLGGFLSRELDFYIKNEVLYLDDINTKQSDFFVAQLSKVKAIKVVAGKIITFLAQIENFQKKLWLKKKFVIRTDYCITLDKIPTIYYPEILQNKAQLDEWKSLFDVEVKTQEQLESEPFLVLDTKFFGETFKDRLLAEFDELDEQLNGLLINSENFQALNLLQEKYSKNIDQIYIDPPYNTESNEIIYKNGFKHSSWISLMNDRLDLSNILQKENSVLNVAIDSAEQKELGVLLKQLYQPLKKEIHCLPVIHNPRGIQGKNISYLHEYLYYVYNEDNNVLDEIPIEQKDWDYSNLRNWGGESEREFGRTLFYGITINLKTNEIIDISEPLLDNEHPNSNVFIGNDRVIIYPIDPSGIERKWRYSISRLKKDKDLVRVLKDKDGLYKLEVPKTTSRVKSIWTDKIFDASVYGKQILTNILPNSPFTFPKSIHNVLETLKSFLLSKENSIVLDYFGGSGTTGHATIKLNRDFGGLRKYILVEMGIYFNTVTKPRIQKVIYSDNWKNGKPQDKIGISQLVKYQVLESYEDTLNNLYLDSKTELDFSGKAKEEYLLQYMLEMESREHLFNLDMFRKPFDYQLKVTENNELKPTKVDLVETFNYLIGLYVSKVQRVKDIKVVEGTTRTGIKTLVIWRDLETTTHDEVEKLLRRFYDSQRTKEFQQIYINGDHHLENLRSEGDSFKIKLIEETFFKKMFNENEL
ncbi:MAG: DNA methyltransferase [Flavobacterium sp.]|uniref:DNA methyltransferase n=1 Tax=Flavobacterium sp. TaxID=239 RepID=UPI0022C97683|nr:DNA methyltransferase [Flavobacterium sp.]MCZ8169767.1 DNA methyltransferase [Flavobacterium sp.]MCZ8295998.1 DNA methyltransferase [Flavobacterium sp.]